MGTAGGRRTRCTRRRLAQPDRRRGTLEEYGSMMQLDLIVDSPAKLAQVFADRFANLAPEAIAARGRFSCALPGGSVAETFFPVLTRVPLAWDRVDFFWGDERAVGPDDADSNYGLAKRLLLDLVQPTP